MTGGSPPIAAVVLDFDGLIVDTETPIFEAWLAAYRRRGHEVGHGGRCVASLADLGRRRAKEREETAARSPSETGGTRR